MFQAFALVCMLNGECAVVSDGVQITERSLCDNFHLAALTQDLSGNAAFLRLASKGSFVNFGCVDVSNIAQEELSNYVIESLRSDEDAGRAGEALPEAQRIVLNQIHSSPLSLHALNPLHSPLKRR